MALTFRVAGFPVRIHLLFWLTALYFGYGDTVTETLVGVVVVFQAILMHELGHAFAGRAFGRIPQIELIGLGGLTWWRHNTELSPWRNVFVSFAGPLVGIVVGVATLLVVSQVGNDTSALGTHALNLVLYYNLGWALLNLLPILPLDGGNILASVCELFSKQRGRFIAAHISIVLLVAATIAVVVWTERSPWTIMVLMMLFMSNWQTLSELRRVHAGSAVLTIEQTTRERSTRDSDAARALAGSEAIEEEAFRAIEEGGGEKLEGLAAEALATARSESARDEAFHMLAWAKLLRGLPSDAFDALRSLSGRRAADPVLAGAVEVELGRASAAVDLLRRVTPGGGAFADSYFVRAVRDSGRWESLLEVARSLVAVGNVQAALGWLSRARDAGFRDVDLLLSDAALSPVHRMPEWASLIASFDSTTPSRP